jgi:hypothetical protein
MGKPSVDNMTGFLLGADVLRSLQLWREQTVLAAYKGNGNTATGGLNLNTHFYHLLKLGLKYMMRVWALTTSSSAIVLLAIY